MRILLDCDGVICNFVGGVLDLLKQYGHGIDESEITELDLDKCLTAREFLTLERHAHRRGFCSSLKPYPGAAEFVLALRQLGHSVKVVTAPWKTPSWYEERVAWLKLIVPQNDIIFTHDKSMINGDVMIEDSIPNLRSWADGDRTGILIDRPWNQGELPDNCQRLDGLYSTLELINAKNR